MSDHWEFYPCQMGEHTAFIFYDHGRREDIDELPQSSVLKIRVSFSIPTENGLPTREEFDQLSQLEDALTTEIERRGGVYVGRITTDGTRHFYSFVPFANDAAEELLRWVGERCGYSLDYSLEPDAGKRAYWDDLFPTKDDWRVIQDMKVLNALAERGDDPSISRRIDHWAYFPEPESRDAFASWASENGFSIADISDPDGETDHEYGVQLFHIAVAEFGEVTHTTSRLEIKAEELGGTYDGWETSVEKTESTSQSNTAG